ncbi:hypothetical protein CDAR_498631 [Caerostris darwini]|uniref:Uncharacterized protein n=1 Tax=Caerostris darwini TaxID=1538125 RepID=A0AAV4SLT4_9ARAC|nr:hypothetical protein CDAR_498631 [Caerostris darwini]
MGTPSLNGQPPLPSQDLPSDISLDGRIERTCCTLLCNLAEANLHCPGTHCNSQQAIKGTGVSETEIICADNSGDTPPLNGNVAGMFTQGRNLWEGLGNWIVCTHTLRERGSGLG